MKHKAKVDDFKLNSDYILLKTDRNAFENVSKVKTNESQSEVFTLSDEEEFVIDSDDDDLHYDI